MSEEHYGSATGKAYNEAKRLVDEVRAKPPAGWKLLEAWCDNEPTQHRSAGIIRSNSGSWIVSLWVGSVRVRAYEHELPAGAGLEGTIQKALELAKLVWG